MRTDQYYLLFPFMNFTCDGTITRLMFIARLISNSRIHHFDPMLLSTWPQFFLWRDHGNDIHTIGPSERSQIQTTGTESTYTNTVDEIGRFEIDLAPSPVPFREGDILGLHMNHTFMIRIGNHAKLTVLGHRKGYGLRLSCNQDHVCTDPGQARREDIQFMPYIAVETGKLTSLLFWELR